MKVEFNEDLHEYKVNGKVVPSVTEVIGLLTKSKYEINPSVLARAAHRGTIVHELCELYDYDSLPEEIDPEVEPFLLAYQQFVKDYDPNWYHIEKIMGSGGFAGTVDRVGEIDGRLVIVDLKTTASMDRLSKISLACQLAGYADLYLTNFQQDIDLEHSFGVQLKKDGTYAIHNYKEICDKYGIVGHDLFVDLWFINWLIRGGK